MAARRPPSVAQRVRHAPGSARARDAILGQQRRLPTTATQLDKAGVSEIHDSRVAARRLRSMLKTFRPLLESGRARLYRADLRSFARALGTAREADVRRELVMGVALADQGVLRAQVVSGRPCRGSDSAARAPSTATSWSGRKPGFSLHRGRLA